MGEKEHERSKESKNKDSTTQMLRSAEHPQNVAASPIFTSYLV